jgi:hypothetical protein
VSVGPSLAQANAILDTMYATCYAQYHLGDPGAAGTDNLAAELDRVLLVWAAASGGIKVTSSPTVWTAVAASETPAYLSLWSASIGGTFMHSLTYAGEAAIIAADYTIPAGGIAITHLGTAA